MADIKEPPKKGLVRGLLGRKPVPKSQKKEKEREDKAWQKKLFGYLEGFKKSFKVLEKGKEEKKKGFLSKMLGGLKGLFTGGLKGLMGKVLGMLGLGGMFAGLAGFGLAMLPAAVILWGLTSAFNIVKDWVKGYKEGGLSGAIATALGGGKEGQVQTGVIAQEVEKVLPEAVSTKPDGTKGVHYNKLIPLLIEAVKDLSQQVDDIKDK